MFTPNLAITSNDVSVGSFNVSQNFTLSPNAMKQTLKCTGSDLKTLQRERHSRQANISFIKNSLCSRDIM